MSRRANVVWITLDSVRQDRTTIGGHARDTTPALERIAATPEGAAFDRCIAHSNWTLASSAAILTGTHPSHNTVGMGGEFLPDALKTVAELFAERGYHTACLSRNSHVSDATGLNRGFDRFEWLASSTLLEAAGPRTLAKYLLNIRRHSAGFTLDTAKHATPYLMNDVAERWLRSLAEPFFFYLHYNEPHRPYYPPGSYLGVFADEIELSPREATEVAMDVHRNMEEIVANGCELTEREWAALLAMYDAEVAYTDDCIGRLFEFVQSLDSEPTVFVVTADHGELFGEHGLLAHRLVLHDAVINVPLVVHGHDEFTTNRDDLVQHADVMQTLLASAGADTSQLQGVDLTERTRERAIAQRGPANFEPFLEHNSAFDTSRFHEGALHAIRTAEFKYQRSDDRAELFALPDEGMDVSEEYPEVTADLDERLSEFLETDGRPVDEHRRAEFTDAMERQLRDLGYVE